MEMQNVLLRQNPEVKFRRVGPSYLLNHQGKVYELNSTAADVWQELARPASIAEIVKAILRQYDIEADVLIADIRQWLNELVGLGMVVVNENG